MYIIRIAMNTQQQSYCLDIYLGYTEVYREELIKFLSSTGVPFGVTKGQCGRKGTTKSLRVLTPQAEALMQHIVGGVRSGDEHRYVIHVSRADAERDVQFMPDYNSPFGCDEFDIVVAVMPESL